MTTIRDLFDPSRPIDRRIEKVITYDAANEDLLKREVQEYIATESIQDHFDRMLDRLEEGMGGDGEVEVGVWVSGFYGSGKSSFTKYLGFALDPSRQIDGKPFLEWLQNRFTSGPLRQRLATSAKRFPAAVIMLDLASEQLAGATMAEITTVLHAKVMQWAGYSRDAKIAYLEFMLEKDGRLDDFKARIIELSKGQKWEEVKNQPLVIKALAARAAAEFYPDLFPDSKTFNEIRMEEQLKEDDRVRQMLDLVARKSGTDNVIFILDEVGQYVAARDDLILNLDGLAKNIKNIGKGRAWLIATAQQTLTEDDPRAAANTAKLFKLKDRFPVTMDLVASDIKEICYRRLLGKSSDGEAALKNRFDDHGAQLRHAIDLKHTKFYKANLDKDDFCKYYPFLPHHFDILLQLLARLAKTRGGVGLRSAIKVIQDILVDPGRTRKGGILLADEPVGVLANAATFFDTLRADIEKPFPHIISGVAKVEKSFDPDSLHSRIAKSVAVLQILEDFPVSRENVAAMLHPAIDAAALHDDVDKAVDELLQEPAIPLNEVDGNLRFMSEAVIDLENERLKIQPRLTDTRSLFNSALRGIFDPGPTIRLNGARAVGTGFKVHAGAMPVSLSGDKEPIQTLIDFVAEKEFDAGKDERITESQQRNNLNNVFLLAAEDADIEDMLVEIYRCQEIVRQHRSKDADKDVEDYLRAQKQRAEKLLRDLEFRLKKRLESGLFVFRAKPRSVGELDSDIIGAVKKHLETVAGQVYEKYEEAPVQVESATAERFLKTEKLEKISDKFDPLGLVKKGGGSPIQTQHRAVASIKDYLERQGQVEGRRLLDAFFAPPFGWSKDTTRYIVAAMLAAGIIKLRVSGEDITVRGETAVNSLKNTNNFNKIGIALRDAPVDPDKLMRARDRLLDLTAEEVMPLEEDISKCVMRHFPDFQQSYGPIGVHLENLALQGQDRAQSIQDNLAEILKGDASDAVNRLGGEPCPLYDDLRWARDIKKAFDNGMGGIVRTARGLLTEIPKLPAAGTPGALVDGSKTDREALSGLIERDDFYQHMTDMQNRIADIQGQVQTSAGAFIQEQVEWLEARKDRIRDRSEWALLSTEDKTRLGAELDALVVEAEPTLDGIKKLLNDSYLFSNEIGRIEAEMIDLAQQAQDDGDDEDEDDVGNGGGGGGIVTEDVVIEVPKMIAGAGDIDALIRRLESLKQHLDAGKHIRITWR